MTSKNILKKRKVKKTRGKKRHYKRSKTRKKQRGGNNFARLHTPIEIFTDITKLFSAKYFNS